MPTIRELRQRKGLSQVELAEALGISRQDMYKLETGKIKRPALERMVKVADFFGVDVKQLVAGASNGDEPDPAAVSARRRTHGRPVLVEPPRLDMIPIRSAARGGDEQEMFLSDPVGYAPRPPFLAGVREAYAVYQVGDSMSPRYEPGWLLFVNPFKPARPGRDVVVYLENDAVMVKQLVRMTAKTVHLRQFSPEKDLELPRSRIREIHLIVGTNQEG